MQEAEEKKNAGEKLELIADVAASYGFSQNYLRFLIFKGKLKGVKQGWGWYTTRKCFEDFLNTRGDRGRKIRPAGNERLEAKLASIEEELLKLRKDLEFRRRRESFVMWRQAAAMLTFSGLLVGAFAFVVFGVPALYSRLAELPALYINEVSLRPVGVRPQAAVASRSNLNGKELQPQTVISSLLSSANSLFHNTRSQIAISQNTSSPPFENLSSTVLAKAGIGEGRLGATPPFEKGRLGGIFAFTLPSLHLPKFSLPSFSLPSFLAPPILKWAGFSELFRPSPPPPSEIAISQNPSSPPFENLSSTAIEEGRLGATPPFEKGRLGGISLPKEVRPLASEVRLPEEVGLQRVNEITRIVERRQTLIPVDLAAVKSSLLSDLQSLNQSLKNEITQDLSSLRSLYSRLSSENQSQTRVITLTQKIDTLGEATLSNITFSGTGNQFNLKDADIPDDISLTGSISPTSLTAQTLSVSGTGTSTYSGGISATTINLTSTTATSTFSNGIQLGGGCFKTSGGTCLTPASPGGANTAIQFNSNSAFGGDENNLIWDNTLKRLGLGTTTPASLLSVQGNALISGTSTQGSIIATSTLFVGTQGQFFNVLQNGFAGIGTTSPGSLLSIHGGNLQVTGTSTANALIATSTLFVGSTGQLFNVLQNGLVGIGTTSPGSLLSVHGGNAQITGTTTASTLIATSTLFVGTQGQFFNVLQNGLVGIGTTSPGSLLSIHGGNAQITGTTTASGLVATSTLFVGQTGNLFNVLQSGLVGIGTTSPSSLLSVHGNALISGTTTAGSLIATSTLYVGSQGQRLLINESGNIGIGTTSPGSLLSIDQVANFTRTSTSTLYTTLSLPNIYSTSTTATSTFAGSLYVASSTPQGNALFAVGTSTAGRASLWVDKNSGNVGIGTEGPPSRLEVVRGSSLESDALRIGNDTDGSDATSVSLRFRLKNSVRAFTAAKIQALESSADTHNADLVFYTNTAGADDSPAEKMRITNAGNVTITGNCSDAAGGGGCTADYAEVLHRNINDFMERGDLLALNLHTGKLVRADSDYATIIGVYSSAPGTLIGQRANSIQLGVGKGVLDQLEPDEIPVALVGRVPLKISTESGPIQIGDRITSSSIPGVGMKATKDGYTVGIALEGFDGEDSTTTAKIHPTPPLLKEGDEQGSSSIPRPMAGMAAEGLATSSESKIVKTGKILVFVNLGYSKLDVKYGEVEPPTGGSTSSYFSVDQTTGKVTAAFTGGLNFNNNSLENVSQILSANGRWQIDENGKLAVREIETEKLKIGSPQDPRGITIYDGATGEPMCAKSFNKIWTLLEGECK